MCLPVVATQTTLCRVQGRVRAVRGRFLPRQEYLLHQTEVNWTDETDIRATDSRRVLGSRNCHCCSEIFSFEEPDVGPQVRFCAGCGGEIPRAYATKLSGGRRPTPRSQLVKTFDNMGHYGWRASKQLDAFVDSSRVFDATFIV